MTESMLVFLSSAEVATCAVSGAETKSDSGEANNKDLDHSLFSVAVEIWTLLGADTKSDSGEANDKDSDQLVRPLSVVCSLRCSIFEADTKSDSGEAKDNVPDHMDVYRSLLSDSSIFSGQDAKSDSGEAKERESDHTRCILLLEKTDDVDMFLKPSALQCLKAFSM